MGANASKNKCKSRWKSMKKIKEFMGKNSWRNKGKSGWKSMKK